LICPHAETLSVAAIRVQQDCFLLRKCERRSKL
jgi:hypothetical protein